MNNKYISRFYNRELKEKDIYSISFRLRGSLINFIGEDDSVEMIKEDLENWKLNFPKKLEELLNK